MKLQLVKREKVEIVGRHSAPKETKLGKYLATGLIAFLLIGSVYFGVTRLNDSTEKSEKAAANERQTTLEKKLPTQQSLLKNRQRLVKKSQLKQLRHKLKKQQIT